MLKKSNPSAAESMASLKRALLTIFRNHPSRNFNYKQVSKLLAQNEPVLFAKYLFIDDRDSNRKILVTLLSELVLSGELLEVDPGRYKTVPVKEYVEGTIDITATGVAYVMNENFEDDIIISPNHTLNALSGDIVNVLLSATRKGGRQEGRVVEIVKRSKTDFAGILQVS
jgi:ribonuclease R